MTAIPGPEPFARSQDSGSRAGPRLLPFNGAWIAAGLLVLAAMALRAAWHVNGDVSWLLELAERTLDGAVPYRDFLEVNPPASILIYMPAVVLARLIGASPERMTDALLFLATFCSLTLCADILAKAGLIGRGRASKVGLCALVVLLILPFNSFAQREHIVVLAMLPILAALAARAEGARPGTAQLVLAGIGAGIGIAIKPMFCLALVGPMFYLIRRQPWRDALRQPETCIAAGLAALYGLGVILLVPDFSARVLPLVMRVYVPARLPALELVTQPTVIILAGLVFAFWRLGRATGEDVVGRVLILASLGFETVFLVQGKGFTYHAYPPIALAVLACGSSLSIAVARGPRALLRDGRVDLALLAVLALASLLTFAERYDVETDSPGLSRAIATLSPHPRVLSITGDMTLGRVFARELGGEWMGSEPIAWVTLYAAAITPKPEQDSRFAGAIRDEQELYAADIARQRPDVILVDGPFWQRWAGADPALAHAFTGYQPAGQYGAVTLWRRETSPDATGGRNAS